MKKAILVALFASLVIIAFWYTLPKQHDKTFEGILYQLGPENRGMEEVVTIEVNGKTRNTLLGKKIFSGTLKLNGEVIPHPNAKGDLEIEFQNYGNGMISYWVNTDATIEGNYYFGDLFINNDLSALTMTKHEQFDGGSTWEGNNGLIISAPATNRAEAIKLSNELMKDFLRGYTLE